MQKPNPDLDAWFSSPLGQYLLNLEQTLVDQMVSDVFGYNAMQVGLSSIDYLRASRIPLRFRIGESGAVAVKGDACHLPVAPQSIDLLILPHVLEFSAQPHQILREAERVLMPGGSLVVAGFNPRSLWGLWGFLRRTERDFPWRGKFISLPRIKDWLSLLGFEITAGRMCGYAPPLHRGNWLQKFAFMEPAGDRWWAMGGGAYCIQGTKRVHGMRLILPKWNERVKAEKGLAPLAQRVMEKQRRMG